MIQNGSETDLFRRNYCYYVPDTLSAEAMREAAQYIEGTHDFACFQASGGQPRETTVRTVHSLTVSERMAPQPQEEQEEKEIIIEIAGDGFLYNMVRIITGTLVEAGLGRKKPEQVKAIIKSGQRSLAGHTAPPQGLYLVEVYYE